MIILAPPPTRRRPALWPTALTATFCAICGVVSYGADPQTGPYVGVGLLAVAAGLLVAFAWSRRSARRENHERERWIDRHADDFRNRFAAEIADIPSTFVSTLNVEQVERVLWSDDGGLNERTCIVCVGEVEAPEVRAAAFEPLVVTATDSMWKEVRWLPAQIGIIGVAACGILLGVSRWPSPRFAWNAFGMPLWWIAGCAVGTTLVWLYKAWLFPRYLRIAPGMIQLMRYSLWRRKPRVESFPISAGTLVVVSAERGHSPTFVLRRRGRSTALATSTMRNRETITMSIWDAILSTAPTPPLSDDELVG